MAGRRRTPDILTANVKIACTCSQPANLERFSLSKETSVRACVRARVRYIGSSVIITCHHAAAGAAAAAVAAVAAMRQRSSCAVHQKCAGVQWNDETGGDTAADWQQ